MESLQYIQELAFCEAYDKCAFEVFGECFMKRRSRNLLKLRTDESSSYLKVIEKQEGLNSRE
jgi:hypothetical protein